LTINQADTLVNLEEYRKSLTSNHEEVFEGMPNILKLINSNLFYLVEDVHALVPNYLQITEAERNKVV